VHGLIQPVVGRRLHIRARCLSHHRPLGPLAELPPELFADGFGFLAHGLFLPPNRVLEPLCQQLHGHDPGDPGRPEVDTIQHLPGAAEYPIGRVEQAFFVGVKVGLRAHPAPLTRSGIMAWPLLTKQ